MTLQLTTLGLVAIGLQACTHYVLRPWVLSRIQHGQEAQRPALVPVFNSLDRSSSSRKAGAADLVKILKAQKEPVLH